MSVRLHLPEHAYRDDAGATWPGVTSILGGSAPDGRGRRAWPGVPPWAGRFDAVPADTLEYKRQVGEAVHLATALDDRGQLDDETVADVVRPYLEAWRRYRREKSFTPTLIEQTVWHPQIGYAGTLDRMGTIGRVRWLVDIKTGSESDADLAGPQTAAYLEAARAMGHAEAQGIVDRGTVHLREDGAYRLVPHTNRRDWNAFLAALELMNFTLLRR
jgi:hypothetical protein